MTATATPDELLDVEADALEERDFAAACDLRLAAQLIRVNRQHYADFLAGRPYDDAPRLHYAWLCEAYGRHERAEFIRVQVELAKVDPNWLGTLPCCIGLQGYRCDVCLKSCRRLAVLRARERALIERHGAEWARERLQSVFPDAAICLDGAAHYSDPDPPYNNSPKWTWHRGFPAHFSLTARQAWGEACPTCDGRGEFCSGACHGSGRVGAILPAILQACPVEEVRISDKEPYESSGAGGGFWWHEGIDLALPHCLPGNLLFVLDGAIMAMGGGVGLGRGWETRDAANAALSRAVIRHGLDLARKDAPGRTTRIG